MDILKYIERNNTYINKGYWPPSNKKYVLKAAIIHYDPIYDDLIKEIKREMNENDLKNGNFGHQLLEYEEEKIW